MAILSFIMSFLTAFTVGVTTYFVHNTTQSFLKKARKLHSKFVHYDVINNR